MRKVHSYKLTKEFVFLEILKNFPEDFKVISLAENARSFYYYAKKYNMHHSCFPMLGSMGQELSMGMGVALGAPELKRKRTVVISSDGSFFANISSLITSGVLKPKKFLILLLDNEVHGITGGQPTASPYVSLEKITRGCNFRSYLVDSEDRLRAAFQEAKRASSPVFIQIKVNRKNPVSKPINELPAIIFRNFSDYIRGTYDIDKKI